MTKMAFLRFFNIGPGLVLSAAVLRNIDFVTLSYQTYGTDLQKPKKILRIVHPVWGWDSAKWKFFKPFL